jgi:hypothetical protein
MTTKSLGFFCSFIIVLGGCSAPAADDETSPVADSADELRSVGPACSETLTRDGLSKIAVYHEHVAHETGIYTHDANVLGRFGTLVHRRRCSSRGDLCTRWEEVDPATADPELPTYVVSRFEELRNGRFFLHQDREDGSLTFSVLSERYGTNLCHGVAEGHARLALSHSRARFSEMDLETYRHCERGGAPSYTWENLTWSGFSGRVGDHCARAEARTKVDAALGYDEYSVVLSSVW